MNLKPPAGRWSGSAPVGLDGTDAWLQAVGQAAHVPQAMIDAAKQRVLPAIRAALAQSPIRGRITVSGYEGSELLVARLLIESGAEVPYVGTACPPHPLECARRRMAGRTGLPRAVPRLAGAGPDGGA